MAFSTAIRSRVNGFGAAAASNGDRPDSYKWVVLSNTTLAVLLATLDASITLIAMPAIFRGIGLDPLVAGNSFYLLWMVLGYLVVSSVLIVSLGRLGDMFGRVRIYNLGFVIYTVASLLLTIDWLHGRAGATYLIVFRIVQGIGGACLMANSAAILTDAFPANQRGTALGINNIVGVSGLFVGLVLGGLLAPISWRMVFLISVPVGLFGTVWAYLKLRELSTPRRTRVDWPGNLTFALGLILIMVAITYGIRPAGGNPTGWTSTRVVLLLAGGVASLIAFAVIERRARDPMFRLTLLKIRAFTFGTLSTFLAAIARGGLMFILIIWLQGIWLPLHGYDFTKTPLWAGIYMLPLTVGMLVSGPVSGYLSDRFGARPFATGGMIGAALSFAALWLLPTDFSYPAFALVLLMNGVSMGLFASPNRAAVMNSLPPGDRGAGGGMNQTLQNSAQVLSLGIFFSLMIAGLASSLPHTLASGLHANGVGLADAHRISHTPPVSVLFAAFLGYNPIQHLAGTHVLATLHAQSHAVLTGRSFFPELISGPFRSGLHEAFAFAIAACLIAAVASMMRGGRYEHTEPPVGERSRPRTGSAACSNPDDHPAPGHPLADPEGHQHPEARRRSHSAGHARERGGSLLAEDALFDQCLVPVDRRLEGVVERSRGIAELVLGLPGAETPIASHQVGGLGGHRPGYARGLADPAHPGDGGGQNEHREPRPGELSHPLYQPRPGDVLAPEDVALAGRPVLGGKQVSLSHVLHVGEVHRCPHHRREPAEQIVANRPRGRLPRLIAVDRHAEDVGGVDDDDFDPVTLTGVERGALPLVLGVRVGQPQPIVGILGVLVGRRRSVCHPDRRDRGGDDDAPCSLGSGRLHRHQRGVGVQAPHSLRRAGADKTGDVEDQLGAAEGAAQGGSTRGRRPWFGGTGRH